MFNPDTKATLSFEGSAQSLLEILQTLTGAPGLTSATANVVAPSASADTATSSASTATPTTAGTTDTGNASAATSEPSQAAATPQPAAGGTDAQAAAASSSDNTGNVDASSASTADATQTASASQGTATDTTAPASGGADAPAVTYEDVTKATLALAGAKGRDAAVAVLGQFGVDHGSKLTPEQWAPYIAAATAATQAQAELA